MAVGKSIGRIVLLVVGGIAVLISVIIGFTSWYLGRAGNRATALLSQELNKGAGPPYSSFVPQPPSSSDNAAPKWIMAFDRILNEPELDRKTSDLLGRLADGTPFQEGDRELALGRLQSHGQTLKLARIAARSKVCVYPHQVVDADFTLHGIEGFSPGQNGRPWVDGAVPLGQLLHLRGRLEPESRLECVTLLCALGESLRRQPGSMEHLIRGAMYDMALDVVREWAGKGINKADQAVLLDLLSQYDPTASLRTMYDVDRAFGREVFERLIDGRMSPEEFLNTEYGVERLNYEIGKQLAFSQIALKYSYAEYLRGMREVIETLDLPHADRINRLRELYKERLIREDSYEFTLITFLVIPAVTVKAELAAVRQAHLAIAVFALTDSDQVPSDPFTGNNMLTRREGNDLVIWSIGENGKDDSGLSSDDDGHDDIVWKLPR